MKKQGFKEMRKKKTLGHLKKCRHPNYRDARGEEEEQEIENLFEKIMKENFPNLAKEIDFQEVQEAQRVPKKLDPKRNTPRHIIIKLL